MRKVKIVFKDEVGLLHQYETEFPSDFTDYDIQYMFTEGNYGCDCNRSIFISSVDSNFPYYECGEKIEMIELMVDGEVVK